MNHVNLSSLIPVVLGYVSGNYLYQSWQDIPNWDTANERTFFQLGMAAVIIIYIKLK